MMTTERPDRMVPTGTAAHCDRCGRITPTALLPLGNHIGNVCADCRTCRRGRPYVSRNNYTEAQRRAEGFRHDHRKD